MAHDGGRSEPGPRGESHREFETVPADRCCRRFAKLGETVGDEMPRGTQRLIVIEVRGDPGQRLALALVSHHRAKSTRGLPLAIPAGDGGVDRFPSVPASKHMPKLANDPTGLTGFGSSPWAAPC